MLHPVNTEVEHLQLLNAAVRYCKSKSIVLPIIEHAQLIQTNGIHLLLNHGQILRIIIQVKKSC